MGQKYEKIGDIVLIPDRFFVKLPSEISKLIRLRCEIIKAVTSNSDTRTAVPRLKLSQGGGNEFSDAFQEYIDGIE